MRTSLIRSYACIISLFSAVRAFNVTVGTPTQCDDLTVTWTGKHIQYVQCVLGELHRDRQVDKHRLRSC